MTTKQNAKWPYIVDGDTAEAEFNENERQKSERNTVVYDRNRCATCQTVRR